jgi:hypothetical protein
MAEKEQNKGSGNKKNWIWEDNPPSRIIQQIILAIMIFLAIFLLSDLLATPDFTISSEPSNLNFKIPSTSCLSKTSDDTEKIPPNFITIKSENVRRLNGFKYPIFLDYEILNKTVKNNFFVYFIPRQIWAGEESNLTIGIKYFKKPRLPAGHYDIMISGRGSVEVPVFEIGQAGIREYKGGKEPKHVFNITIIVEDDEKVCQETKTITEVQLLLAEGV